MVTTPIQTNLYIDQGVDYKLNINIIVPNDDIDFDLDDWDFSASAAKLYSSSIAITAEMTKIPATEENPINSVEMYIPPDQTYDLEPGKYMYDVLMHNTDTEETRKILEGLIFILPSITRL